MKFSLKIALPVISLLSAPLLAADIANAEWKRKIVHAHLQLYSESCIPTAVELVLILAGRVPSSYYDLQREWKNSKYGTFDIFVGRTIAGLTFHRNFWLPRCAMFPFKGLFSAIDAELNAGRFVIIGLRDDDESPFHAWVIVERLPDGEYLGFSKNGAETMEATDIRRRIISNGGTDFNSYTADEEPNKSPQRNAGAGRAISDEASPSHRALSSEKTACAQSPRG